MLTNAFTKLSNEVNIKNTHSLIFVHVKLNTTCFLRSTHSKTTRLHSGAYFIPVHHSNFSLSLKHVYKFLICNEAHIGGHISKSHPYGGMYVCV